MNDRDQLAWEAKNAPNVAIAAFASGVLTLVAVALQFGILLGSSGDLEQLHRYQDRAVLFVASGVAQALAFGALAVVVWFFRRAITARAEATLGFLWPLAYVAPVAILAGNVLASLHGLDRIDAYFNGDRDPNAHDLLASTPPGNVLTLIGLLLLAVTFVNLGVTGMRAGLFSRFMGILGAICGVLTLFGGGFIQLFWTVAVGFLLLNRWPQGRGPAWSVVEPVPWPTAVQQREAAEAADRGQPESPAPASEPAGSGDDASGPGKRRKKKKRR